MLCRLRVQVVSLCWLGVACGGSAPPPPAGPPPSLPAYAPRPAVHAEAAGTRPGPPPAPAGASVPVVSPPSISAPAAPAAGVKVGTPGEPPPPHCPEFEFTVAGEPPKVKADLNAEHCMVGARSFVFRRQGVRVPKTWMERYHPEVYTYDDKGRLIEMFRRRLDDVELRRFRYEGDHIVSQEGWDTTGLDKAPGTPRDSRVYEYDPRGYLLRIRGSKRSGDVVDVTVTYDSECRIVAAGDKRYVYGEGARLRGYDYAEGRITAEPTGLKAYRLDPETGRQIQVEHKHIFGYDGAGRLNSHKGNGLTQLEYADHGGLISYTYNDEPQELSGYCPLTLCSTPPRLGDANVYPCFAWGHGPDPVLHEWPSGRWSM